MKPSFFFFCKIKLQKDDFCSYTWGKHTFMMRLLTTLLQAYLGFTVFNNLFQINTFGLYSSDAQHFKDLSKNVADWHWVFVGGYTTNQFKKNMTWNLLESL